MTSGAGELSGAALLLAKAELLIDARHPAEAWPLLFQASKEDGENPMVWAEMARCQLAWGRPHATVLLARSALHYAPQLAYAHRLLTHGQLGDGDLAGGLASARECVRLDPGSWVCHWSLSEALRRQVTDQTPKAEKEAYLREALEAAGRAVELDPENPGTHEQVAQVQSMRGRKQDAHAAWQEVLRLDPADTRVRADLVRSQAEEGQAHLSDVISAGTDALAASPQSAAARHELHHSYHRMLCRTRWVALLSLLVATLAARVFPTGDDPAVLPVELGQRLYGLAWIAGIWTLTCVLAWRRLPRGAWRGMRALLGRSWQVRSAPLAAAWCLLCAVALLAVGWRDRAAMQWVVHAGWAVTLAVMYADYTVRENVPGRRRWPRLYG
ncbi:hypothetical protein [Streptomyces axinellae]|uniref:Tetratricopeptide repeat protein n=1 Tax=Streptomyces axinellae TaxID=552788 RepID=A0ABP6CTB3_9ACTN